MSKTQNWSQSGPTLKWRNAESARRHARDDLAEAERVADWLDSVFRIPGTGVRFGLDPLLGLIPGLGDTLSMLASLYLLNAARKFAVPKVTMARMALNVAIDYVIGLVPLLGDVFDVYWKANRRNVALLRRHLASAPGERRRAQWSDRLFVGAAILALAAAVAGSIAVTYWIIITLGRLLFGGG